MLHAPRDPRAAGLGDLRSHRSAVQPDLGTTPVRFRETDGVVAREGRREVNPPINRVVDLDLVC